MSIAENIKTLRKAASLTQGDLAEKAGVSFGAVQYAENPAHEPSIGTLRKLAHGLNVPVLALIGEEVSGEALGFGLRLDKLPPADRSFVVGILERFEALAA